MIQVFKMSNGDELIGELVEKSSVAFIIDKPRVIFHNGEQGGLMPYCISNPDVRNFPINPNLVVGTFKAPEELADVYRQSTTSIQLLS